jgi:hypothetical protein
MTTMTIHADDVFAEALRTHARKSGKSINQTVKDLLAPILGIVKKRAGDADNPFMKFCGVLPKGVGAELSKAVAAQRRIDPEMWK